MEVSQRRGGSSVVYNIRSKSVLLNVFTACANPKTVNTRIISGMLLCCEEKANQVQDEKTTSGNGN